MKKKVIPVTMVLGTALSLLLLALAAIQTPILQANNNATPPIIIAKYPFANTQGVSLTTAVYGSVGTYTAVVTASNPINSPVATTIVTVTNAPSTTYTVCKEGPPTCDFSVIQTAVDAASSGDTIKVAAGVYTDVNNNVGLAQIVIITKSVTIQGGYTTDFVEPPDPNTNITTLDAQDLGRAVVVAGVPEPITVTVAGLRITDGRATGLGGDSWINSNGDAGGGIYVLSAALYLQQTYLIANVANPLPAPGAGGGLFAISSTVHISNSQISGNSADLGGGMVALSSTVTLSSSAVLSNTARQGGGFLMAWGEAFLTDSHFEQNSSVGSSGGGGGFFYQMAGTANRTIIHQNSSVGTGGGFSVLESDMTFINSVVTENDAFDTTGGSGLYFVASTARLWHSTIANNLGTDGIVALAETPILTSQVALTNSIIAGHLHGIYVDGVSTGVLQGTLWHNNVSDHQGPVVTTADFTGDPAFVNPAMGDYHIISPTSAALDLGLATMVNTDIDGQTRPLGTAADLGADEWHPIPPIVGLLAQNNSPTTLGTSTYLTATITSGTNVTYTWSLGDGLTGNGAAITHVYPAVGIYTAVVTASNQTNSLTATTVVTITDVPIAGLTAVNDSPTSLGSTTTLTANIMTGTNVIYSWNLGDGSIGNGSIITHSYLSTGIYTAVVTVSNQTNSLTATTGVSITDVPVAGLTAVNNSPTSLGSTTTLTASVTSGSNVTYTWSLGDGFTGSGAAITHVYPAVGTYTAVVTASNATNSLTATTVVTITDVPIAGLTALNDSPTTLGGPTTLTASVTSGSNVTYTWSLGDGFIGSGAVIAHDYPAVGIYTAVVTASNATNSLTAATVVTITDVPIAGLTAVNDSPTTLGSTTMLTANITAGTNVTYSWNFGDGMSAVGDVISYQYAEVGVYMVVVTASNAISQLTATTVVTVQEMIEGLTAVSDSPTILGETTTLSATIAAGSQVSYMWQLGDGTVGYGQVVTHSYGSAGIFTVTVTAVNAVSVMSATTVVVVQEVIEGLTAVSSSPTILGETTTLSAIITSGSQVSYIWQLGDDTTSYGAVVTHSYSSASVYTATVTAVNAVSAMSATIHITIATPVQADFVAVNQSGTVPLTAVFSNTSSGDYDSSLWHFGDGNSSTEQHPSHIYTSRGTYTVTLTISGIGGTSTLTRTAYITVLDSHYAVYLPLIRAADAP